MDEAVGVESACWRCASPVGPGEVDGAGCRWCRPQRLRFGRAVSLGVYDDELREAIHGLKYHADRAGGLELGRLLGEAIGAMLDAAGVPREGVVLVPVPASFRRRMLRNRGVDHALTIARGAAAACGCGVRRVLARRHGPSQTEVAGSSRAANVRGVFGVRAGEEARPVSRAVLIDDVRTTGATLNACCRAMEGILTTASGKRGRSGGSAAGGRGASLGEIGGGEAPRLMAATAAVSVDGRRARGRSVGGGSKNDKSPSLGA